MLFKKTNVYVMIQNHQVSRLRRAAIAPHFTQNATLSASPANPASPSTRHRVTHERSQWAPERPFIQSNTFYPYI